jgi:hypothetical protein
MHYYNVIGRHAQPHQHHCPSTEECNEIRYKFSLTVTSSTTAYTNTIRITVPIYVIGKRYFCCPLIITERLKQMCSAFQTVQLHSSVNSEDINDTTPKEATYNNK